jgi:methyl-accepting chemotaxis protein
MAERDLRFRYLGDASDLTRASGQAEKALGGVDSKARSTDGTMGVLKKGALKLGAAFGASYLAGQIGQAVSRAEDVQSAFEVAEQIIKQTGGAAGVTAGQVQTLSEKIQDQTAYDKLLVAEGANVVLTFKNIRDSAGEGNDVFTRTVELLPDMAEVMQVDMVSASKMFGKALNDPIAGMAGLARAGVQFSEDQKKAIRAMVESGDLLGAQKLMLEEIESQIGGTAAASADATDKIANSFKEMQEAIGNAVLPIVENLVPAFQWLGDEAPSALHNIYLGFRQMEKASSTAVDALDFMAGPLINMEDGWTDVEEAVFQVNRRMEQYRDGVEEGKDESMLFVSVLGDLIADGDSYETTVRDLIDVTGISGDKFRDAAGYALAHRTELGLNETQADNLKRELQKLETGTSDLKLAAGEAGDAAGDFGEDLEDVEDSAEDARAKVEDLRDEMRKLSDPVYAAEKATDKFNDTLAKVQEDGEVTQDELEELAQDWRDMQAAVDDVSAENIDAFEQDARGALQFIDDKVKVTRDELGLLGSAAVSGVSQVRDQLNQLLDKKLQVAIQLDAPSPAEMDTAVLAAWQRLKRRGMVQ